jgi:lysozyme family protein
MNFDEAFSRLLGHEGGYVDNPKDPGGETNWGISKRSYPEVDIKALTMLDAKAIYLRDFWNPIGAAHPAIKFQAFDFAVNSGITTAIRKLQSSIGAADDGHWGPLSASRLAGFDTSDVLMIYLAERLDFMRKLSNWPSFSSGWAGRIADNLRFAAKDN